MEREALIRAAREAGRAGVFAFILLPAALEAPEELRAAWQELLPPSGGGSPPLNEEDVGVPTWIPVWEGLRVGETPFLLLQTFPSSAGGSHW